ncbi:uncharacterized protein LOC135948268 isoform X2 [Cloeon dipterum]|uniref:uncharacterized protein LOC135948268 isoform X2 n=1 Tax=Cloeon dipterum TaxID=197152 RepID=UPI0032201387
MDFIKKFIGIAPPKEHSDGGFKPSDENDFEVFDILPNGTQHRWHSCDIQEYMQEMERKFQEMLIPFQQRPEFSNDLFQTPAYKQDIDGSLDGCRPNADQILEIMEQDRHMQKSPIHPRHETPNFFQLPPDFKSFSRSVSIQTSQRPDGVWETRKVVRDEHGNEQVTVTEQLDRPGNNGSLLDLPRIGADFPQSQFNPPDRDHRGMSLIDKLFGRFST